MAWVSSSSPHKMIFMRIVSVLLVVLLGQSGGHEFLRGDLHETARLSLRRGGAAPLGRRKLPGAGGGGGTSGRPKTCTCNMTTNEYIKDEPENCHAPKGGCPDEGGGISWLGIILIVIMAVLFLCCASFIMVTLNRCLFRLSYGRWPGHTSDTSVEKDTEGGL